MRVIAAPGKEARQRRRSARHYFRCSVATTKVRRRRRRRWRAATTSRTMFAALISLFVAVLLLITTASVVVVVVDARGGGGGGGAAKNNLYKTLGASKASSPEQLKKAYRKACLKHHPDKGGDKDKFQEVSRAYEVLSDPEKRELYDRYGEAGIDASAAAGGGPPGGRSPFFGSAASNFQQGGSGFGGGVPPDFFSQAFGGGSNGDGYQSFSFRSGSGDGGPGGGGGGGGGASSFFQRAARPGANGGLDLDLEELLNQMLGRQPPPRSSRGGGGGGTTRQKRRNQPPPPFGFRPQQSQQQQNQSYERPVQCTLKELAFGATKKLKVNHAGGRSKIYRINVKPGWKEGTKIKFPASTSDTDGYRFPAMTFIVVQKKHPYFERREDDVVYRHKLRNQDGLIQGPERINIVLLDGTTWSRSIPVKSSLLRPGQCLTVPDQGMPIKGGHGRGNLIVEFY